MARHRTGKRRLVTGHDPEAGRLARLRERFAAFGGLVKTYLASLERDEQIHCAAIESLELDRWRQGRVVLIGDAAHASSPMMGQGGCMAVVGMIVGRDEPERHRVISRTLQLAARKHPVA